MVCCHCRKRAAAKQLIEAYYFQLTDGCGNNACDNPNCASCPNFVFKDKDKNVLALTSIDLFKQKAALCQRERNKVARLPSPPNESSFKSSPLTTPNSCKVPLPGPSGAKSSSGATPKSFAISPIGKQVV